MFALALLAAMFAAPDETVIVYTSKTCPPCNALKRDYAADPDLFGDREVHFVSIDGKPVKGVSAVPTFVLIRDWKEIERRTGYGGPESIRSWLK
tara:strand:+ start:221 stop:502 length:282 start_codon:yes stop_codon:yes gene_type:complete